MLIANRYCLMHIKHALSLNVIWSIPKPHPFGAWGGRPPSCPFTVPSLSLYCCSSVPLMSLYCPLIVVAIKCQPIQLDLSIWIDWFIDCTLYWPTAICLRIAMLWAPAWSQENAPRAWILTPAFWWPLAALPRDRSRRNAGRAMFSVLWVETKRVT